MKKILLLIIFSFLWGSAFSQKVRFSDSTNRWTVFDYSCGGEPDFVDSSIFTYQGDTIIHDTTYRQLNDRLHGMAYIREDTALGKVFAIYPVYDTDTAEKVLYDYTLHIGDTLNGGDGSYYVNTIDSVIINGIWHKVWDFEPGTGYFGFTVIEGIGCIQNPTLPLYTFWQFETCIVLTCFSTHDSTPPLRSPVGYWRFDNASSCSLTFGLSVPVQLPVTPITISPNPTTTFLTISFPNKITSIIITNLLGETLCTNSYHNEKQVQVNVADLPAGVYFVKVNGTMVRKFIKE